MDIPSSRFLLAVPVALLVVAEVGVTKKISHLLKSTPFLDFETANIYIYIYIQKTTKEPKLEMMNSHPHQKKSIGT